MPTAIKNSIIDISSEKTTKELAKKFSNYVKGGEVIFLYGEMGVGKTTFAKHLINQFQINKKIQTTEVLSPTFNLLYEYDFRNYKIMHYDLYRLTKERELIDLGLFSDNKKAIKIIEWPTLINTPVFDKLEVHIDYFKNKQRKINLIGTGKWKKFK